MTTLKHDGCRVCGRTDVDLKQDGTLRMHVHADRKGNSFLAPNSGRCDGAGRPPKGVLGRYALSVLGTLYAHFHEVCNPIISEVVGEAVEQYHAAPYDHFECLLNERGTWRLRPHRDLPGRVRVACWDVDPNVHARELEQRLNDRLDLIRTR